jgi:PEP-CTERM motif
MKMKLARLVLLAYGSIGSTHASQLIINGGFETGTLSGWTVTTQAGSYPGSNFFATSSTTTPVSGSSTVGAKTGTYYAVSDNIGSSTVILSEVFAVPSQPSSLILSYSLFVNSYGGTQINTSAGLDYNRIPSQFGIVSLLSAGTSLFSTSAGVLRNFYLGTDSLAGANPYVNYSFDITSLVSAGGSYILRFGEVGNLDVLNLGVDNVSLDFTAAVAAPEPSSAVLLLFGVVVAGLRSARRR